MKSFYDGQGKIDQVTYDGITLSGITGHRIPIEQNYDGGDLSKTHGPGSGVPISCLTIKNISGAGGVTSKGTNVAIVCANCTGWTWNTVTVTSGFKFSCVGKPPAVLAGVSAV
ncbi:hypothetical protein OPT61_g4909 [Boeremia exigua]|uniref:Uncharacterized protein n=1 Tax=Boeremia exigua TaxID=749465 RepID=A0ACC2ICB4_9PLEO|nr:hypothetical protein OPT61_g4909 [Boeremia exigua]